MLHCPPRQVTARHCTEPDQAAARPAASAGRPRAVGESMGVIMMDVGSGSSSLCRAAASAWCSSAQHDTTALLVKK